MKLSTGKIAFPIEFDNGDKQNIYFNPNDPDLVVRFEELKDRIADKLNELDDFEMNADGRPKDVSDADSFRKTKQIMCDEIDRAFGGEVSNVVFKYCNPLAVVNGQYFIWHFIEAITPEMKKQIESSNKAANQRLQKHIAKYQK